MSWRDNLITHKAGETFGKLVVLRRATVEEVAAQRDAGVYGAHWVCRCSGCGREKLVYGSSLRSGASRSCGKHPCRRHA
jgi:ribosomal protein S27E